MPRYGFSFLWVFAYRGRPPVPADLPALDQMAEVGLGFVRVPTDYNFWTRDFDYLHPDEQVLEQIDGYLDACRQRGLQMCLNSHRAPGYCINRNDWSGTNSGPTRSPRTPSSFSGRASPLGTRAYPTTPSASTWSMSHPALASTG